MNEIPKITRIPDNFYTSPEESSAVITREELHDILLFHEGRITANGHLWDIKSKHLGAGVYRVFLKKWKLNA